MSHRSLLNSLEKKMFPMRLAYLILIIYIIIIALNADDISRAQRALTPLLFAPSTQLSTITPFLLKEKSNTPDSQFSIFSSSSLFKPTSFSIDDTNEVSFFTEQVCNPSNFGYSIEDGLAVFPPYTYPECSAKLEPPYPELRFDYSENLFYMLCPSGDPYYILEPVKNKGRLFKFLEMKELIIKERYLRPVKLTVEEFVIGSCGGEIFNQALYITRFNRTVYEITKQRMIKLKQKSKPLIVFLLTVDSYSRRHFFRKLPKTIDFINNLNSDLEAFDFKLHNVFGESSVENIVPIFTDQGLENIEHAREYDVYKNDSMWGNFRDKGFVTLFGLEDCNYYFPNAIGRYPEVDHIIRSYYCVIKSCMNFDEEIYSKYQHRCVGSHMSHWYALNYTHEFTQLYSGLNQWIYLHLNPAHEGTGQHAGTLDADLLKFLQKYFAEFGQTHEFAIFLQADHGMRYGNWYNDIEAYQENKLPVFFFVASKSLLDRIPNVREVLQINTLRLTTKKDLRPTINYLAEIPYKTPANTTMGSFVNLFTQVAGLDRTCDQLGISPFDCSCLVVKEIRDYESDYEFNHLVLTIANEAVNKMNYLVHTPNIGAFGICTKLTLGRIFSVRGLMLNNKVEELQIKFGVNEAKSAIFEVFAFSGTHVRSEVLIASSYRRSVLNYIYRGFRNRLKIFGIKRMDKYAGRCEDITRSLKLKSEYCICYSNYIDYY